MRSRTLTRALGAVTLTIALAVTTTACGTGDGSGDEAGSSTEPSATEHNAADVAFASDMIQHHAQALSMVDLTLDRPLDPEVQAMAEQIRAAQAPEIETFSDLLSDWDQDIPETMRDHSNADHDGGSIGESMEGVDTSMPGMMSADDMSGLEAANDGEFQARWLDMMIEHHTGALEMARIETEQGRYQPALDLANDIIEGQSAEIETMRRLLDS